MRFTVLLWQHNTLGSLYFVMETTCIRFIVLLWKLDTLRLLYFVMERRRIRFIVFCYGNKTQWVHCILLGKQDMLGSLYFVMETRHVRFIVLWKQDTLGSLYFVMETRHVRFLLMADCGAKPSIINNRSSLWPVLYIPSIAVQVMLPRMSMATLLMDSLKGQSNTRGLCTG